MLTYHKCFTTALLLFFIGVATAFAQDKLKFHVVSFENDVFDTSAKDDRWKKVDGSGSLYAIIKVTDENADDLKAYTFNFGNMNHFVEEHNDELWVYVQKNAKTVTITRNGYATLHRYDLQTTIGEGKTYKMVLSSQGPVVHTQMVLFQVSPADAKAVLSIKGSEPDAVEQMLGVVDASGALAKNMTCGTYVYHVLSENYYPSEGRIVLNDPSQTHREEIVLRPRFSSVTLTVDADADIYVNGEKKGTRSWTGQLNAGNYQVECRQASHRSSTQSIVVEENVSRTYTLTTPTPITGTLSVISSPLGATIQIDGKEYGTTPQNIQNLLIGNHTLTLTKEGFDATESTIVIKAGETTEVSITLSDIESEFQKAYSLWKEKKYDQAYQIFSKLANQGDVKAQCVLGDLYQAAENYEKAFEWYEKAANQGDSIAQNTIGLYYSNGIGVAKNEKKAFEWYERAANQGYAAAQINLAACYVEGEGIPTDNKKAFEWIEKAANQGNARAKCRLGTLYENGIGVEKDYQKAVVWYEKAANQGDALAQCHLAACYEDGIGITKDYKKAFEWYKKAANQGNTVAQNALGFFYCTGQGVEQDYKQAAEWYQKAAEQGDARAQYNLSNCYINGWGVTKDLQKAAYWKKKYEENPNK